MGGEENAGGLGVGAKRGVKGHFSPAGTGEHPRGLVLACDTKGQSGKVSAPWGLENWSCRLKRLTHVRAADPESGNRAGEFPQATRCVPLGSVPPGICFRSPTSSACRLTCGPARAAPQLLGDGKGTAHSTPSQSGGFLPCKYDLSRNFTKLGGAGRSV